MCTLILLYQLLEEYPVILAENRDASVSSAEIPPSMVSSNPGIYSAIDKRSGGTWFGLNENRVALGLTNLYSNTEDIRPKASRGQLCLEALKQPTAIDVSMYLKEHYDHRRYAKMNILAADRYDAILTMCDIKIDTKELDEGIHILTNYNLAHAPSTQEDIDTRIDSAHRRDRALELSEIYGLDEKKDIEGVLEILKMILSDHQKTADNRGSEKKKYFTICCHDREGYDWKTMSSSIIALSKASIEKSRYLYCPGNPCKEDSEYEDYSHILKEC
ncbi:MAG: NRDE family protein [archaeon]